MKPDRVAPGEGDDIDAGMLDEGVANDLAGAGKILHDGWWHAGLVEDADEAGGDHGRLFGRLEDGGVTGGESGGRHSADDGEGEVPRGDESGDAAALEDEPVFLAGHVDETGISRQVPRLLGVVAKVVDGLDDVAVRLSPGFAAFVDHGGGEIEAAFGEERGSAPED